MRSVPLIVLVFCIELFVVFVYFLCHLTNVAGAYRLSIAPSVLFNIYCFKFQLMSLVNIIYNSTRVLIDTIMVYQEIIF